MASDVETDSLIERQRGLIESIGKTTVNFGKDSETRKNEIYFRVRLDKLDIIAKEFRENDRILSMRKLAPTVEYMEEDWGDVFEENYLNAVSAIESARDEKFPKAIPQQEGSLEVPNLHSTLRHHNGTHSNSSASPRLQRIELPSFAGLYREWPSFRDIFLSLIHLNGSLSDVEKFHYLKGTLTGEPALMVKHLTMTATNYKAAWKLLDGHFTNDRELFKDHMCVFSSLPFIVSEDPVGLRQLLNVSREFRQSLGEFEIEIEHCDAMIVFFMAQKLPAETAGLWETKLGSSTKVPKFRQLETFLDTRIKSLDAIEESRKQSSGLPPSAKPTKQTEKPKAYPKPVASASPNFKKSFHVATTKPTTSVDTADASFKCCLCGQAHPLRKCPSFLSMTTLERRKAVSSNNRCENCLAHTHTTKACHSKFNCRCGERHHTMLHLDPSFATHTNNSMSVCLSSTRLNKREVLLSTAVVRVLNENNQFVSVRALIDSGSQATLITEHVANMLGLQKISVKTNVTGISGLAADSCNHVVRLTVSSRVDSNIVIHADAFVLKKLTGYLPNRSITNQNWSHFASIDLADPEFNSSAKVDLIIGADIYAQIITDGLLRPLNGSPTAQNTLFGWILFGSVNGSQSDQRDTHQLTSLVTTVEIDRILARFWDVDSVPEGRTPKPEEEWCEKFFESTVQRDETGRFIVRLPFRFYSDPNAILGKSRLIALQQFSMLERKFARNPPFHVAYRNCIREYFEYNQIEPVRSSEQQHVHNANGIHSNSCCYLTQPAIIKSESTTTKLRVVFDASRKTSNGASLNDILLPGPALQNDLPSVLTNWRFHRVVASADLKQMFRQILVAPQDAQFQRIFWRDSPNDPLREYYLKTVTFGTKSAPYLAIRTILQLAQENEIEYPNLARFLKKAIYVDDAFFGSDSVHGLQLLVDEANRVFASAGFELRKWTSNSDSVLRSIPEELREVSTPLALNEEDAVKTLGLFWLPNEDAFRFKFNFDPIDDTQNVTKRNVLSVIARLFDPLGFIAPVVIVAKFMLRRIWLANLDWDVPVPEELKHDWITLSARLDRLTAIRVPRWFNTTTQHVLYELHAFSDASSHAYAACIYLRTSSDHQQFQTTLITAKTKIAPIKPTTIPRLELLGAHLLGKLLQHTLTHIQIPLEQIPIFAWTDSEIVLYWLRGDVNRWETFVSNRVGQILEVIKVEQWRHVPTTMNPADCASRGLDPEELIQHPLWWSGPPFLQGQPEHWPSNIESELQNVLPVRVDAQLADTANESESDILLRFSRFDKLLRVTAIILRFHVKNRNNRSIPFGVDELNLARDRWIQIVQSNAFGEEISALRNLQNLPKKSKLLALNPFIDEHGFLRVGGRLQNSLLSYNERHPMILPAKSHFTALLIREYHRLSLHGGPQLMLCLLRKRYWVINARNTVRFEILKCMVCFRLRAKASTQLMGNLPSYRVRPSLCFQSTGVDFAGPIKVSVAPGRGRATYKGYIAVFVCMAVKAVHLEVVSDLTTNKFLEALHRFIGRRGMCAHLYSDNGSTFVGATNQLKRDAEIWKRQIESDVVPVLSGREIHWHFIPAGAPEMGGLWERNVGSMKHHLKRICTDQCFTYEEWSTFTTGIEACLNSRPLCAFTADINDATALTPGHFLVGEALLAPPEPNIEDRNIPVSQRYARLVQMKQRFWRRWSAEYLGTLQPRSKNTSPTPNFEPGTLVLIKDERLPPLQWPLGRIVEVHPGSDGLVRAASVLLRNRVVSRPVTKMCRLPFEQPTCVDESVDQSPSENVRGHPTENSVQADLLNHVENPLPNPLQN